VRGLKMKIAISSDLGMVSSHFGRCPEFTIVEIENNNVVNKEVIPNPGHKTGFLPGFFNEKGVNYVIAGGAGSMAQQFFDKYNIKLIVGVQGKIDQVIDDFIHNKLEKGNSMCKPGDGKDYGIEKEDKKH